LTDPQGYALGVLHF